MPTVLQMKKRLRSEPEVLSAPGFQFRIYRDEADVLAWLDVRRRAFARSTTGVRDWTVDDFQREVIDKAWWRPDWFWLAEAGSSGDRASVVVGAVMLALRGAPPNSGAAVNWLAVLPSYRRQGVAAALMSRLEHAAWSAGHTEVWLETHAAWREAAAFYVRHGYEVVAAG